MGFFTKKEKPEIGLVDVGLEQYKPKCPHCKGEISEIHRFLLSGNEEAVYACPLCHQIIGIGSRI